MNKDEVLEVPFQETSLDIWSTKYRLCNNQGEPVDITMEDTYDRTARALADIETGDSKDRIYRGFKWALANGAIPAGRIMSNVGAAEHKPGTSPINCLGGDTPVLTDQGTFPIKELAELGTPVNVLNGNGNWSSVTFQSHGQQELYPLVFKYGDNNELTKVMATRGHRWPLSNDNLVISNLWLTSEHDGTERINNILVTSDKRDSNTWEFVRVDGDSVIEEVYCCAEPETQSFCIHGGMLTGNCVVSGTIEDSMEGIVKEGVGDAAITLAAGCGIGYEFSTIRPKGAFVNGAGATTNGPLPFADIYDAMCFTVSSAGGRRG